MNAISEEEIPMSQKKICVLIPTYNNAKTLRRVIDGVLKHTCDIIVINDGSTDDTFAILQEYTAIKVVHFEQNQGKGMALQRGFREAKRLGFSHAITIDSDGQHFPDDIPVFVETLSQSSENVLLIGNRNMSQEGIPKKSSFGNRFSCFWYWVETGISLEDTQSGYRMYPLDFLPERYYTPKFEFEIEVIVRAAWRGTEVKSVPVRVLYDPSERVSHFRPIKDFARISVLNTVLVFITFLYIVPRNFIRNFRKKSFTAFLKEDILQSDGTPEVKAKSIALGLFIGLSPFWGFHTFLTISLSVLFRLNKLLAFAFSNVSLPPFIPFIVVGSLWLGGLMLGTPMYIDFKDFSWDLLEKHLWQYIVGSFLLSATMSLLVGSGFYVFLKQREKTNREK